MNKNQVYEQAPEHSGHKECAQLIDGLRSEFEQKHAKWFSQQIKDIESYGLWSDDLRVW